MTSRLPLRHYRHIPRFLRATLAIRRQLRTASGLVGYALVAQLFHKTFWTLSAWTDDDSLQAFVRTDPHRTVMARIHPLMEPPTFAFLRLSGRDLPPEWASARDVLRRTEPR
jgi:quinol monooxygenase YgiN